MWAVLLALFLLADVALLLSVLTAPRPISSALLPTAAYLEQNPAPTPEFISNFLTREDRVCVDVSQRPFARVGVSVEVLGQYIIKNQQFKIDDTQVEPTGNIFTYLTRSIENGKEYGGDITFCFDIGKLKSGLHLATMTIPDFDGVEHTYTWAFRYDANFPTSDPNVLLTPLTLPSLTPTT